MMLRRWIRTGAPFHKSHHGEHPKRFIWKCIVYLQWFLAFYKFNFTWFDEINVFWRRVFREDNLSLIENEFFEFVSKPNYSITRRKREGLLEYFQRKVHFIQFLVEHFYVIRTCDPKQVESFFIIIVITFFLFFFFCFSFSWLLFCYFSNYEIFFLIRHLIFLVITIVAITTTALANWSTKC